MKVYKNPVLSNFALNFKWEMSRKQELLTN